MENRDYKNQMLDALRQARAKIEEVAEASKEPIAIIGIGCHLPGRASSKEEFWSNLIHRVDAKQDIPKDRWENDDFFDPREGMPGKIYVRSGYFIDKFDFFDSNLFGLTPREVVGMDPQHRILIETVWRSIVDANIDIDKLTGSQTGLFVGGCTDDYSQIVYSHYAPKIRDAYHTLGSMRSTSVGRVSHLFGWHGPALHIDTACSSSLVALHLACQSLRLGECNLAVVAGVNAILSPESVIARCQLNALSPEGRSKAFDEQANGYGLGEGAGAIVLKRLSAAEQEGDRIYATICGSAVNHDGRSGGLTVPNQQAQQQVIRSSLKSGSIPEELVAYVEAHGSGTALGDPIEIYALESVFGDKRENKLLVGSVKSNIGHLEGAAGIAGVIKTSLSAYYGSLPAHMNFRHPTSRVDWARINIEVLDELREWPKDQPYAGVSAFGLSGTNAHVSLKRYDDNRVRPESCYNTEIFYLSAGSKISLKKWTKDLAEYLKTQDGNALAETIEVINTRLPKLAWQTAIRVSSGGLVSTLSSLVESDFSKKADRWLIFDFSILCDDFLIWATSLFTQYPEYRDQVVGNIAAPFLLECKVELLGPTQKLVLALQCAYRLTRYLAKWNVRIHRWQGDLACDLLMECLSGALEINELCDLLASGSTEAGSLNARYSSSIPISDILKSLNSQAAIVMGLKVAWVESPTVLNDEKVSSEFLGVDIGRPGLDSILEKAIQYGIAVDMSPAMSNVVYAKNLPPLPLDRTHFPMSGPSKELDKFDHLLLQCYHAKPGDEKVITARLAPQSLCAFQDHQVYQKTVLPMTLLVETCLSAVNYLYGVSPREVCGFHVCSPVVIEAVGLSLAVMVKPNAEGYTVSIYSERGDQWLLHAEGQVNAVVYIEKVVPGYTEGYFISWDLENVYSDLSAMGLNYGLAFQRLQAIKEYNNYLLINLSSVEGVGGSYVFDPVDLDACFQALAVFYIQKGHRALVLPTSIETLSIDSNAGAIVNAIAHVRDQDGFSLVADLWLFNDKDICVGYVKGLRGVRVNGEKFLEQDKAAWKDWLFTYSWTQLSNYSYPLPSQFIPVQENSNREITHILQAPEVAQDYQVLMHDLEKVASHYALLALDYLKLDLHQADVLDVSTLVAKLGVLPKYERLLSRLLDIARESGSLYFSAGAEDLISVNYHLSQEKLRLHCGDNLSVEMRLLARCGSVLAEVLKGDVDPLQILFEEDKGALVAELYKKSLGTLALNQILSNMISNVLEHLPKGRSLRILEVGAGTAATSEHVLSLLEGRDYHYVFTDISSYFVEQAKQNLGENQKISFQTFDLEKNSDRQGLNEPFDIIIAANVLHAVKRLEPAVEKLRKLLMPGGILLLVEGTGKHKFSDLTFGLTDGWWHFEDLELRSYPLISGESWKKLLTDNGFNSCSVVEPIEGSTQAVLIAHADLEELKRPVLVYGGAPEAVVLSRAYGAEGYVVLAHSDQLSSVALNLSEEIDTAFEDAISTTLSFVPSETQIVYVAPATIDRTALQATSLDSQYHELLSLMQAMARLKRKHSFRLTILTHQAIGGNSLEGSAVIYSLLWGMARVFDQEHPEFRVKCVDVGEQCWQSGLTSPLLREVLFRDGHKEICMSNMRRSAPRLIPLDVTLINKKPVVEGGVEGVYVITGGLGGIGLSTASWLQNKGIKNIALVSRREPNKQALTQLSELRRQGVTVKYYLADVAEYEALAEKVEEIKLDFGAIQGIVHSVGVLRDDLIMSQSFSKYKEVLAPKVQGLINLHYLTLNEPIKQFVVYSSASHVIGTPGQSNHAAANRFLDEWIAFRHKHNLPAQVIAWGPWSEVGEVADHDMTGKLSETGLMSITSRIGGELMDLLMSPYNANVPHQVITLPVIDWERYLACFDPERSNDLYQHESVLKLYRSVVANTDEQATDESGRGELALLLSSIPVQSRLHVLSDFIYQLVDKITGQVDSRNFSHQTSFFDMGIDSLMAVELKRALEFNLDFTMPSTVVFKYPSVDELSRFIIRESDIEISDKQPGPLEREVPDLVGLGDLTEYERALNLMSEKELSALLESTLAEEGN